MKDYENEGLVKIFHCTYEEQLEDILTKSFPRNRFEYQKTKIGVAQVKLNELSGSGASLFPFIYFIIIYSKKIS